MDARELLLAEHALVHSDAVAEAAGRPIPADAWSRLSPAQLRTSPPDNNSLAWLLWHTARSEDMGVNALVRGQPEVLDRDGWYEKLNVPYRHVGTGSSAEEVAALNARVNTEALLEYRDAVGRETREWLTHLDLGELDSLVNAGPRITATAPFADHVAPRMSVVLGTKSAGWYVVRLAIWHNFFHIGHAEHVMHLLGVPLYGTGP
ncbi:MAG TPA: DinB family protein [Dehalococcoidia bacterium]|nr:DinB family protein [Dehalococcoidia bacterium]